MLITEMPLLPSGKPDLRELRTQIPSDHQDREQ